MTRIGLVVLSMSLILGCQSGSDDDRSPGKPRIASIAPDQGGLRGSTSVIIETRGFKTPFTTLLPTVEFGGVFGTAVGALSETAIRVNTPPHATEGAVDVILISGDATQRALKTDGFLYTVNPVVLSVDPGSGHPDGGEFVTIRGDQFDLVGPVTVTFGGSAATAVLVEDPTRITCVTPPGPDGTVDVTVTNPGGESGTLADGFSYARPAPSINGISPVAGDPAGGDPVTITGKDFDGPATVTFGGADATAVVVVDPATITCVTPAGAPGPVTVVVENPDGQFDFLQDGFVYTADPVVTSVVPSAGDPAGGDLVSVLGANFDTGGGVTVTFGAAAATGVIVSSPASLTCFTPAGPDGPVTVTVQNPGGGAGSLVAGFTYSADPVVTAVTPDTGDAGGGEPVIVTGNNFRTSGRVRVYFDINEAANIVVVDGTTITCDTPPGPAGPVTVTVENPNGDSGSLPDAFTYFPTPPDPVVVSVSPNAGDPAGGDPVTIHGSDFDPLGTVTVTFGGVGATGVVVVNTATIDCVTPPGSPGPVTVVVSNPSGKQGSLVDGYTYTAAPPDPIVSSVSPGAGDPSGGDPVTVHGNNFETAGTTTVTFGGAPATGVSVINATRLDCITPPGPVGPVTVVVNNPSGGQGSLADGFTYSATPPDPVVNSVNPSAGAPAGGDLVTVHGNNFETAGTTTVTFGGADATGVTVVDAGRITCYTPAGSPGPVTVVVYNPSGGQGSLVDGFTYVAADPAVIAAEDRLLDLINQERIGLGKSVLIHDPDVRDVARAHSEDMRDRDFFDHVNPDGDGPGDRLIAGGISYTAWAENIAWNLGYPDPPLEAFNQWMGSSGHKRNMLDEGGVGYTLAGIGVAYQGNAWWFTAVFVRQ